MVKVASVFFANKDQEPVQKDQTGQQNHQQEVSLEVHCPLFLPPREASNTPIINNIADITIATIEVLRFISSLTKGCITANTSKATAKFIKPLPSSFSPLNKSIESF